MSEPNQQQQGTTNGTFDVDGELASIVQRNILPARIAQKIGERLKEKNIKVSKDQLYKLVDKIQNALRGSTPASSGQPGLQNTIDAQIAVKEDRRPAADTAVQTTDMKRLLDAVDQLNERLTSIEENRLDGVKGVTGKLVRTKDMHTLESAEVLAEDMQPLEHVPSDPESIVVIMKWLQYLVDKIGKNNLPDILGYYVDISWISDDVRLDLMSYSKGIVEAVAQGGVRSPNLPTKDHLQSLLFIQKLKGCSLDDRFLSKIERDMEKMAKSLEGYSFK